MTNRIAIIPARGGSKRIPNKNVRDFCGRPMVAHVLDAARDSGLFHKIHVSTDSNQVAAVVDSLGFVVDFMRPSELADDHTPIMPVLKFVLEQYADRGLKFDQVWLLMACAPNLASDDLRQASGMLEKASPRTSLVSISEYPVPIEWAFARNPSGLLEALQPGMFARRSQDIEPRYYDTGTFAVFSADTVLRSQGASSDSEYLGFVLPKGSAVDIDTETDWSAAEALFHMGRSPSR
jgi:N-acylneuraminate cytidylyltransferase